jgi:hypothetical protein
LYIADALQILEQLAFLGGQLRGRGKMLQGATPANSEVRAPRRDAIGGRNQYLDQACLVHLPASLVDPKPHPLRKQRTLDEHRLACDARDAATVVREIDDICFLNGT